mmetsp:Transcript_61306/g.145979  ORF Transcript_61306/g.145979 Transcript_61306/m.145979 type:complete len:219 (+) Transcript_61306:968-1624(+)
MMSLNSWLFASRAPRSRSIPGISFLTTSLAAAMCMAVGKLSLLLCPRFAWSLGCTGDWVPSSFPKIWLARFAITSLTFMFVCVPDPVWKMTSGKWSSHLPLAISSHAWHMAFPISSLISPMSMLYCVQHFFRTPYARHTAKGILSTAPPIGKFCKLRWVCAPQRRSAATSIGPKESFSVRVAIMLRLCLRSLLASLKRCSFPCCGKDSERNARAKKTA